MMEDIKGFVDQYLYDRNPWTNPEGHSETPKKIRQEWKEKGITSIEMSFELGGIQGTNIFVPPKKPEEEFILFMAHHDTVPNSPGADDNLSGMATVHQLLLAHKQGKLKGNYAFALTDFEEGHPRLWEERYKWESEHGKLKLGTQEYFEFQRNFISKYKGISIFHGTKMLIKHLRDVLLLPKLKGVINFESVGYFGKQKAVGDIMLPEDGNYLVVVGNHNSQFLLNLFKLPDFIVHRLEPLEFNEDARRSDHALFWDINVPAVMVTDTANYRNPNYHTEKDMSVNVAELNIKIDKLMEMLNFSATHQ